MDKLDNIYKSHGEWPQAIKLSETEISADDLYNPELTKIALDLAEKNPRQRAIIQVHEKLSDENHLMINAILGESYVPPHKHEEKEKTEIFRIVKGKAYVVFFDDQGNVEKKIEMNSDPDGRKVVVVRSDKWHTVIPTNGDAVVLEAKRQPVSGYNSETDKTMAPWAPKVEETEKTMTYIKDILASIDKSGE